MTVGVAIQVPRKGCVLVCDSRVTGGDGNILTDADQKWLRGERVAAICAGMLGAVWDQLLEAPPKTLEELRARLVCDKLGHEYDVLATDGTRLWLIDQTGARIIKRGWSTIGCGGDVATGYLDALGAQKTLEAAEVVAKAAVRAAIKHNVACGGRVQGCVVEIGR